MGFVGSESFSGFHGARKPGAGSSSVPEKRGSKGTLLFTAEGRKGPPTISSGYWTSEFMLGAFDHHDAGRWPLLRSSSAAEQVSPAPVSAHNPVQITQGE